LPRCVADLVCVAVCIGVGVLECGVGECDGARVRELVAFCRAVLLGRQARVRRVVHRFCAHSMCCGCRAPV
jgi:hypothetical protein